MSHPHRPSKQANGPTKHQFQQEAQQEPRNRELLEQPRVCHAQVKDSDLANASLTSSRLLIVAPWLATQHHSVWQESRWRQEEWNNPRRKTVSAVSGCCFFLFRVEFPLSLMKKRGGNAASRASIWLWRRQTVTSHLQTCLFTGNYRIKKCQWSWSLLSQMGRLVSEIEL